MSYSVEELLNLLKLDEYLPNFINNNITNLRIIDESLLIKIGIEKIGHRKRIINELENLLGTGSYFLQTEHTNDKFNGNVHGYVDNNDDGEVAPPLPPKLKPQKNVENSCETNPPIKPRPVKPPRTTAPGCKQKPIEFDSVGKPIPPSRTISQTSEPIVTNVSNSTLPPVESSIQTTASSVQTATTTVSTLPVESDDTMASIVHPSINFPPPPAHAPPPTPKSHPPPLTTTSHLPPRPIQSETINNKPMRTFSQKHRELAVPDSGLMNKSQTLPREPVCLPRTRSTDELNKPKPPAIPPRDYPGDRLTHASSIIRKQERMLKTQSVDLMSFSDIPIGIPHDNSQLHRSTKLKKSNTIGSSNKKLEAALRKARLNKELNSEKGIDNVSFDQGKSLDGDGGDMKDKSGQHNKSSQEDASCSDDDLSEDEEDTEGTEGIDGIQISMRRDKDELISIFGQGDNTESKQLNRNRKSRYFQPKGGNLHMRIGKKTVRRWVEFTGSEIKCYKEKNDILKLTIPVIRMADVIWEKDAKKPTFHITTKNKQYTFIEPVGDHDAMTIWAKVLLEGVLAKGDEEVESSPGGIMANPDMEGYLSKEGHNILHDVRKRYVVIKENKLCYYNTKEEFEDDMDFISCLEMALVSLKHEEERLRLILNTHTNKSYVFQAEDMSSFNSWKEAIETSIQYSHGDDRIRNQIQENQSNTKCADCGDNNPIYASINLLVVACPKCIGFHRDMGVHISKTRSLLMDERVWTPSSVKLLQTVGNDKANSLWSHNLPSDDMINPNSSKEEREEFIKTKYKEKKYFDWSPLFGQSEDLGNKLREVVVTDHVLETLQLLISGANIYYVAEGSADQRTPYELAKEAGMELQQELLYQFNGHLTREERKELEQQKSAMQQTKTGILQIKTTRSDTLKERQCTLLDKRIEVKKMEKIDECEIIDLTKLEELEIDKEDRVTLILKLPDRTYFLKSYLPEETESWYHAIRTKQVFGVPIDVQECNKKKIPYLIGECISFMEQHALMTEGIYRLSGSQLVIKKLNLLFNQDAANLKLLIEDYPDIHAVAGLIKLYLRQLPDPLLTKKFYEDWIRNAEETRTDEEHTQKLYRYKSLLEELPPCNYKTLRFLILHLNQVINLSELNKMALNNIIVIFGPILQNSGNTVDQAWLKREYSVLSDLLTYYQWLFDVTEVEVKVLKGMIDFLRSTQQTVLQQPLADFTMVTIFIGENEDQMQMTPTTRPSEVCLFCLKKHKLSANTNWGLFEVTVEGEMERLVHASESVLRVAETMGVKRKLVVKCNYVTDIIAANPSTNLTVNGNLHFSKGDRWRKNYYVEVKTGNIRVYKQKGNTKEEENLAVHEIQLFIGNIQKKKPLTRFGFALYKLNVDEFRYFGAEDELELNKFIAIILQVKYPSGVWTPISTAADEPPVSTGNTDDSSYYWGRQSTVIRPNGTANRLRAQLERRRTTLKNIFMK